MQWFYLNNRRSNIKPGAFWNSAQDEATIKIQIERRKALLAANRAKLNKHRAFRAKT